MFVDFPRRSCVYSVSCSRFVLEVEGVVEVCALRCTTFNRKTYPSETPSAGPPLLQVLYLRPETIKYVFN